MPVFLAIETTTKVCSVAVLDGAKVMAIEESDDQGYDHAENLNPFIVGCLEKAQVSLDQVDAILVSQGPGSYTGLRIGVSSAKGLCFAKDLPLIAINPMRSMVEMAKHKQHFSTETSLFPMLDARRREVYTQNWVHSIAKTPIEAKVLEEHTEIFNAPKHVAFGPGADKFSAEFKPQNYLSGVYPSARFMGVEGMEKFDKKAFEDLAYFEPFYLKDFVAIKAKPKFNRRNT